MSKLIKSFLTAVVFLSAGAAYANVDCSTDTCIYPEGTVTQLGLDNGNFYYVYNSSLPQTSATSPYLFVKLEATGIGIGANCSVGNDAVIAFVPFNSAAREAFQSTLLHAKINNATVQLVIKDDTASYCELATVLIN